MKKYTLDQITDGQYIFLERPEEINQFSIPENEITEKLSEGDIVNIQEVDGIYRVNILKEETRITRKKVNDLLEKLKNKK